MHVLQAQSAGFIEGILSRRHAACHYDHRVSPAVPDSVQLT
jgi:hypothetical protein